MRARIACTLLAGSIVALGATLPANADARPRISGFYAADEGRVIHFKVNYCVSSAELGDSMIATFRMWDAQTDRQVVERRVSGRAFTRCRTHSLKVPDTFQNGRYLANVGVTNRSTGAFIRIAVRPLIIS